MEKALPTRFEDLDTPELYRTAIEDFAAAVEETDKTKKRVLLAALLEAGVSWDDYVAMHPEIAPVVEEVIAPTPEVVVEAPVEEVVIRVKEEIPVTTTEKFLVKMTRENPLYEVRGYKFTKENPYALVSGKDVEHILSNEDGFRQAMPSEVAEYYR